MCPKGTYMKGMVPGLAEEISRVETSGGQVWQEVFSLEGKSLKGKVELQPFPFLSLIPGHKVKCCLARDPKAARLTKHGQTLPTLIRIKPLS